MVDENGATPPVSYVELTAAAVVTLAVGVPELDVPGKHDVGFVTELRECLKTTLLEKRCRGEDT